MCVHACVRACLQSIHIYSILTFSMTANTEPTCNTGSCLRQDFQFTVCDLQLQAVAKLPGTILKFNIHETSRGGSCANFQGHRITKGDRVCVDQQLNVAGVAIERNCRNYNKRNCVQIMIVIKVT